MLKRLAVYVPLGFVILYLFLNTHFFASSYIGFPKPEKSDILEKFDSQVFSGAPIKAGFAKQDITPGTFPPLPLAGYTPWHHGWTVHDRLWVKSLALRDENGNTLVIVSCDLIGLLPNEIKKILGLVKNKNIDRNHIFINTTHTHSGPDTMGIWGFYAPVSLLSGKDERYMKSLRRKVAEAIDASLNDLRSSSVRFGQGEFLNRANGRHENAPDPSVSVMQVRRSSGEIVTLVNFAVHADLAKNFSVSADFPYYLSERLRAHTGGEAMFVPGAIGGVQPEGDRYENKDLVRRLGEDLADRVMEIMKRPIVTKKSNIVITKRTVTAPLENKNFRLAAKLRVVSNLAGANGRITAEISKIRIGPAEILTVPGELFPKIWWRVKAKMGGGPKMIFGLTNGEFGYILLPEDVQSGKHKYHVSVSIGPTFGEEIDKTLQQLATE